MGQEEKERGIERGKERDARDAATASRCSLSRAKNEKNQNVRKNYTSFSLRLFCLPSLLLLLFSRVPDRPPGLQSFNELPVDLLRGRGDDPPVHPVEPPSEPKVERGARGVADAAAGLEDEEGARGVVPDLLAVALEMK